VQDEATSELGAGSPAWYFAEYRARLHPAFVERLIERLALTRRDRVLDLDAGAGSVGRSFASCVSEVVSVEERGDLRFEGARRAARGSLANVTFVEGGPGELTKLALYGTFKVATVGMSSPWLVRLDDLLASLAPIVDDRDAAVVFLGGDAAGSEQLYGWRIRLAQLLEQFSPGLLAAARAAESRPALSELLGQSAFTRLERVRVEYEVTEQPWLEAAIGLLYSYAGVLERLGHRRAIFERVARDELGWVDRLPKVGVKRADVALIARREG
jgi:hypothetical protein